MSKLTRYYDDIKQKNILSIQINLLNECTSRCKYCRKYTWPCDRLDIRNVRGVIEYLRLYRSLKSVTFSGGDPILHHQLVEILQHCKDINVATSIITTLITDDKKLLTDIAMTATRIHVSVDGANKQLYLKTRGVDKFDIVKENIKFVNDIRLANNKKPIRISSTISNINQDSLQELFDFAVSTNSTLNYYFIHRYDKYNPDVQLMYDELAKVAARDTNCITNASKILQNTFTNKTTELSSSECNIPYIHCLINANGDVYPCCKLLNDNGEYGEQTKYVYGNIIKDQPDEIFDKCANRTMRICEDCNGCEERYIPFIDEVNAIINDEGDVPFL